MLCVSEKASKATLSDMCCMPKRATCDGLLQTLRFHCLLSRWVRRGEEEVEGRRHDFKVVQEIDVKGV